MEKNSLLKLEKLDMPVVLIKVSLVLPVTHLVRAQDQENPPRGESVPATCNCFSSITADPEGVTQRKTRCSRTSFARKALSGHLPELSKCGTGWAWRCPLWACVSAPPGHQPAQTRQRPLALSLCSELLSLPSSVLVSLPRWEESQVPRGLPPAPTFSSGAACRPMAKPPLG